MEAERLTIAIEKNIHYKILQLEILVKERKKSNRKVLSEALHPSFQMDPENDALNQALTDAILHAMASLVDYYCVYTLITIGVPERKITKVQYRSLNNDFLLKHSKIRLRDRAVSSFTSLREKFDREISDCCQKKIDEIPPRDYWICFFNDAILYTLNEYGIAVDRKLPLTFDRANDCFAIDKKVRQYYFRLGFLFCNPGNTTGVRYNIYLDVNNCLKHNTVPYVRPKMELFGDEKRMYSYFEIKNEDGVFLKDGILKDIVDTEFEVFEKYLESRYCQRAGGSYLTTLEQKWALGPILQIDRENGYVSDDKATLYFFVDGILIIKTPDATLVDAEYSLHSSLSHLIRQIKHHLQMDFSSIN